MGSERLLEHTGGRAFSRDVKVNKESLGTKGS